MRYYDLLRMKNLDVLMLMDDLGAARREYGRTRIPCVKYVRGVGERTLQRDPIIPSQDGPWGCEYSDAMFEVGYQTGSGNRMVMLLHMFSMEREDVPLVTEWEQVAFCGDCKGSSGGCPGFAPKFSHFKKSAHRFVVITVSIDFIWAIMYATPRDGWIGSRIIKQLMYTDRLTENYCKRMLKHINKAGFPTLGLGNCAGCRPKQCTVIRGRKCKFPLKRTFSMEATGIDCDALHMQFYDECLPWYYKGTSKMPMYMTRYVGVLVGHEGALLEEKVNEFIHSDKSFVPGSQVPEPREATISLLKIPTGQHVNDFQYVYNDPGLIQV